MKKVKSYPVSEFKAKSLAILEQVSRTREEIQITKRGKPIARVLPMVPEAEEGPSLLGKLAGTVIEQGDIMSPFGPRLWQAAEGEWQTEQEDEDREPAPLRKPKK